MADSADKLNLIKNPALAEGHHVPRGWRWRGERGSVEWRREAAANGQGAVITLRAKQAQAAGGWCRRVRCQPDAHYRIEVVVSCDCRGDGDLPGFLLSIQPLQGGDPVGQPAELVAPPRLDEPTRLRAYYHTPDNVRSVEVQVGLAGARGMVRIHEVMMFEILEPEAQSHPLAVPAPPYAHPGPKRVRSICVCARTGPGKDPRKRPIVELLCRRFGRRNVRVAGPADFGPANLRADAVLFPDILPRAASNLAALEKLAAGRVVIVSLPGFASLAGRAVEVRTVVQADDPIHAKVRFANFITRGFALDDAFPYAWRAADPRAFGQRHFRRTPQLRQFCRQHGFEIILSSLCNRDATSDHPICLYKPTGGGGIVVLDLEPAEDTPTSFDEPDLAFYVLGNVLGADQNTLGQYTCPAGSEKELRDQVYELGERYADSGLVTAGGNGPDKPRRDQFVTVRSMSETIGVRVPHRPVILIRTGLRGDEADGVYGTMIWLKDLLRGEPYANPYAAGLLSRYRLAWIPLGAEWHPGRGWRRPDDTAPLEPVTEFDPRTLAAMIDVTSTSRRVVRVAVSDGTIRRRCASLLPDLARRYLDSRFFYRAVPAGGPVAERQAMDWRWQRFMPHVLAEEAGVFDTPFHRKAVAAGVPLVRLEFPAPAGYLPCSSIWRTDLVAQTLEHVVGLIAGWTAMNRQLQPLRIIPPPVGPGERLVLTTMTGSEPVNAPATVRPGQAVSIRPGAALRIIPQEPFEPRTSVRPDHRAG